MKFYPIPKNVNIMNVLLMAYVSNYDIKNIYPPTKEGKKLSYLHNGKFINFGSKYYDSYDRHLDKDRRESYLKRAKNIKGNWKKDKYSPNNLSINLLWSNKINL